MPYSVPRVLVYGDWMLLHDVGGTLGIRRIRIEECRLTEGEGEDARGDV